MDDWEALFAKAEGRPSGEEREPGAEQAAPTPRVEQPNTGEAFADFLRLRSEVTTGWPLSSSYFELGSLMVEGSPCQGFTCTNETADGEPLCDHCHGPSFLHSLQVVPGAKNRPQPAFLSSPSLISHGQLPDTDIAEARQAYILVCSIRNIRCAAKFLASSSFGSEHCWRIDTATLKDECRELTIDPGNPFHLELRIRDIFVTSQQEQLKSKLELVGRLAQPFCTEPLLKADWQCKSYFHMAVRLIMACDDAYLQLYYMQLIQAIGPIRFHGDRVEFLPHPTAYFASMLHRDDISLAQATFADRHTKHVREVFAWDVDQGKEHALVGLHRWRWAETVLLFRSHMSWWSSPSRNVKKPRLLWKSFSNSLVNSTSKKKRRKMEHPQNFDETEHETPAPDLLREWRDSCRDFLCHLYAYATTSNEVLMRLKTTLQLLGATGITEMGAGTGYLAFLLQQQGFDVEPYDVAPPGDNQDASSNEYHGQTPPFVAVRRVTSKMSCAFQEDIGTRALVLCYPPPDSAMASTALREFRRRKGQFLVHIGEFKGLTGSRDFETYLLNEMVIVDRLPCLTWGTDASEVSVWAAKDGRKLPPIYKESLDASKESAARHQLICRHCCSKEATRRCRFVRLLCYCSKECYECDLASRRAFFEMSMIDLNNDEIDFNDDRHYKQL
jgi:hypothetical protein